MNKITTKSTFKSWMEIINQIIDSLSSKLGVSDNAVSATKAEQDSLGNVISDTYSTKEEVNYKLSSYLPLIGGTVIGPIISGEYTISGINSQKELGIFVTENSYNGAGIYLHHIDDTRKNMSGSFTITARSNDNTSTDLNGRPDGSLLWGDKNLVRSVNNTFADENGNVSISSSSMPVGAIYVQFSGQAAPSTLFGGTWSNVSSSYAGLFFRAEGGSAAAFGSTQAGGLPEISGGFTLGSTGTQGIAASGAFYMSGTTGGDDNNGKSASPHVYFKASNSNGLYGAASEVRTINSTIRIWKRTA